MASRWFAGAASIGRSVLRRFLPFNPLIGVAGGFERLIPLKAFHLTTLGLLLDDTSFSMVVSVKRVSGGAIWVPWL